MKLINLYKGYETVFNIKKSVLDRQDAWVEFMSKDINVRQQCIDDYIEQGLDWKEVSLNSVFIYDKKFVDRMNRASVLLERIVLDMRSKLSSFYKLELEDTIIVIYHGLGNAAGWATTYEGKPAIYLGVEKIVELGWDSKSKLEDLVSHEYGHLVHMDIRKESLEPFTDFRRKMIYRTYTEGVATYCESIYNGREISSPMWYQEAIKKEELLKKEFMRRLDSESENITDFFGDWYPVLGLIEAGYFLGLNVIKSLLKTLSIVEVMSLDIEDVELEVMKYITDNNL